MARHAWAPLGVAMVLVAMSLATTDVDDGREIVMLGESETAGGGAANVYSKIPGFKFNFDTKAAKVDNREGCEKVCNGQSTCKSYSWAENLKECEWSTSKMQYDPEFVFNFKPANGGSYHQFPGLVYRATGWLKSEDKTESECAGLCDAAAACSAFSYRKVDSLCLLSGHAIGFDENFDYFEKAGAHASFSLKAKAAPDAAAAASKAKSTKSSQASMIQAAVEAAKAAVAGITVSPPASSGAQGVPESQVAERLEAVKQWAAQKLKAKDDEEKLKMKAFELDANSKLENQKAELAKAAAKKEAVQAEIATAGQQKRDAEAKSEAAKKEVADANEKTKKAEEQAKLKADAFKKMKTNTEQEVALVKEKDEKAAAGEIKTAVASNVARARAEMAEKAKLASEESVERNQKSAASEKDRKSVAAQETAGKKKEIDALKDKVRAEKADLQAANQKISTAAARQKKVEGEMKLGIEKAKDGAAAKIAANEVEAKATANEQIAASNLQKER